MWLFAFDQCPKDRLVFKCYLLSFTTHLMLTGSNIQHSLSYGPHKTFAMNVVVPYARLHSKLHNISLPNTRIFNATVRQIKSKGTTECVTSARVYVCMCVCGKAHSVYAFRLEDNKAQTKTTRTKNDTVTLLCVSISNSTISSIQVFVVFTSDFFLLLL